jgi:hypothetical protein
MEIKSKMPDTKLDIDIDKSWSNHPPSLEKKISPEEREQLLAQLRKRSAYKTTKSS